MIDLLYKALASPLGICVRSADPERLRQKLYAERRKLQDPGLEDLSFAPDPVDDRNLWILNRANIESGAWKELYAKGKARSGEGHDEFREDGLPGPSKPSP